MSHKILNTINNQSLEIQNNQHMIKINNILTSISNSQNNNIVKFNSSNNWVNSDIEAKINLLLGINYKDSFISVTSNYYSGQHRYNFYYRANTNEANFYVSNNITTNIATNTYSPTGADTEIESINIINSGTYLFIAQAACNSYWYPTQAELKLRFENNTGEFGPNIHLYANNNDDSLSSQIFAISNCSNNDIVRLKVKYTRRSATRYHVDTRYFCGINVYKLS